MLLSLQEKKLKTVSSYKDIDRIYDEQITRANTELLKDLLEHNCDVNAVLLNGNSPLMLSFSAQNYSLGEMLLESNLNPLIGKNEYGENLLHVMARHCHQFCAGKILKTLTDKVCFVWNLFLFVRSRLCIKWINDFFMYVGFLKVKIMQFMVILMWSRTKHFLSCTTTVVDITFFTLSKSVQRSKHD